MNNLEFLKSSPALQILNQLSAPLAIAQKTASLFDAIQESASGVTAMAMPQHAWINDMSQVTNSLSKGLQKWALQPTPAEKAIESLKRNTLKEVMSKVSTFCWEPSRIASVFESSPIERILETMNRDVAPIATAMKSAQEKWTAEAEGIAKITEGFRHYLARESATLATVWKPVEAARVLDPINVLSTLDPPSMPAIHQSPAWATPIFLEQLEVPMLPKMRADNLGGRRLFRNYRMAASFDLLSDFERGLRDFIHRGMCETFGTGWEKIRLPCGMYEEWEERRKKARTAGESSERLIDYADFTDYVDIISRKDNWKEVFRSRLERREFVQESLYRLHSVRLCTMHSRILPHKMWQVLQTETLLLSDKMWN